MEHRMYAIVIFIVFAVSTGSSLVLSQNQNQNLQVLSFYGNRYEEYSATDGSLVGSLDNSILVGPTDIESYNGNLYVSGLHYKVSIYNQTTLEYQGSLINYTQQATWCLSFLPPKTLAVCLVDEVFFTWSLDFLDVDTGESYATIPCSNYCFDVIQHPFNSSKILVATSTAIESYLWNEGSYQFDTIYFSIPFDTQDKVTMQMNGGLLYVALTTPIDVVMMFQPQENEAILNEVFFEPPVEGWNLRAFAFFPNSTTRMIAVGHVNFYGYIYDFDSSSNNLTLYAHTNLNQGYYVGCTEGVYFDQMGFLYVADWAWVLRFNISTGDFVDQIIHQYGFQYPQGVTYNPSGDPKIAYVSTGNKVLRVDRSTFEVIDIFIPQAVPWASDGQASASQLVWHDNVLYVGGTTLVTAYSPSGAQMGIATTPVLQILDMKLNPKNGRMYVTSLFSTDLLEISLTSMSIAQTIPILLSAFSLIAFSNDGEVMYACDSPGTGFVAFNTSSWTIQQSVSDVVTSTFALEVGTDGNLYVLANNGTLVLNGTNLTSLGYLTPMIPNYHSNASFFCDFFFAPTNLTYPPSPSPAAVPSSSATPNSDSDTSKKNDKAGAVIGGVVGGVGGALICAALVGFLVVRRQRKQRESEDHNLPDRELSLQGVSLQEGSKSLSSSSSVPSVLNQLSSWHEFWEIDFRELDIGEEIGRGAFGSVFKGEWRNSSCVVKQLQIGNLTKDAIDTFLKEANTVKFEIEFFFSQTRSLRNHGNVCTIFGVTTNPERPICIVMEYCSGGSLQSALATNKIAPTFQNLIKIFRDITSGMGHVHREGIVHCDLACRNILVSLGNGEFSAKISDFGLARQIPKDSSIQISDDDVFPIRWSAPEILRERTLSFPCDVWSFGVVMWEIIEGGVPYSQMNNADVVQYVTEQKKILPEPNAISSSSLPSVLYDIMKSCWTQEPAKRPTFDDLNREFRELDKNTELKESNVNWSPNSAITPLNSNGSQQSTQSSGSGPYANLREDKNTRYSKLSAYGNNFSSSNSE